MQYTLSNTYKTLSDSAMEHVYTLTVRDMPIEEKPREKLMAHGADALSSAELLAIILGVGTKKEEVLTMTSRIVREYGEEAIVDQTSPEAVSKTLNVPIAKACQIVATFALGRRFFSHKQGGKPQLIRTPKDVWELTSDMRTLPKEQLRGFYLNSRYTVVHSEVLALGSVDASIVHPREVFRPALEYNASALILVHNHPSGDIMPSKADLDITQQLAQAGELMGIELLDHIVVTQGGYQSIMGK